MDKAKAQRMARALIIVWVLGVFLLYYSQYADYAGFFIANYVPKYFPFLAGVLP